jgi:DNA modification methylase
MDKKEKYANWIKGKSVVAESFGIETNDIQFTGILYPHQKDIANFCLQGGRRAIFASFGLGKTAIQLEIARILVNKFKKHFLIACPLGVSGEFKRDCHNLGIGLNIDYIRNTNEIKENINPQIFISNYERIRNGEIDSNFFIGVSMDEASVIRNRSTDTTNYVLEHFKNLKFRYVATATPTPNDFIEILNYADFLGVIDRGQALTRFFQRDSQKAGNLKLYEHRKEEFWQWVSTWAAFINSPSDYGYDGTDYILPKLNLHEHIIDYSNKRELKDKHGENVLIRNIKSGMIEAIREKRDSLDERLDKSLEIAKSISGNVIMWHHLEDERKYLEKKLKGENYISVYGSQNTEIKEKSIIDFSESRHKYLLTKPEIAGSGCNFQHACSDMIFCGIDYSFNDFIQAIHRSYRFKQKKEVNVHLVFTRNEYEVYKVIKEKWEKHKELNLQMISIIKEYGLNKELIKSQMERQIFKDSNKVVYENHATIYNNDCVNVLQDNQEIQDNSVQMILTSIPFGNHYEYSENYNDFGHNHNNQLFYEQMDFLIPELHRVIEPGRVAAIHVKDRIQYAHQNGIGITTISDFSGQCVIAFERTHILNKINTLKSLIKQGIIKESDVENELRELEDSYKSRFHLIGKITVTTDVVAENNQTYRLGWTEKCKDGSKLGVGLPEYVLLFRKQPSDQEDAYSDNPVKKEKSDYPKARWQLDAHSYWRSNGDRFLDRNDLKELSVKTIVRKWKEKNLKSIYDYKEHLRICKELDEVNKLSSTYMTLPIHSNNDMVWTDVTRMRTLNANQVANSREKHICPLQFDIIERLIESFTMRGETVLDPFNGLGSTVYSAIKMRRKGIGIELNSQYFRDSMFYINNAIQEIETPTLFDFIK